MLQNTKEERIETKTTIVTALWDLGRGDIGASFKRSYEDYLKQFSLLLQNDANMYIFIDPSDEEFIWKHRKRENTVVKHMTLDELTEWFEFTDKTNEIRQSEAWLRQAAWLGESPQATLESYNPVVMSKMFMLNNVTIWNPFNSEYFFWIDAGITSTVNNGYFSHDKVFDKLPNFIDKNKDFVFLSYPYEGGDEVHGFKRPEMAEYCNTDYVKYVCRGGFFGGKKGAINEMNGQYYHYLSATLSGGLMGTEESIFTIMMYNNTDKITQYMIEGNGLIYPFFEDVKNLKFKTKTFKNDNKEEKLGLYIITFNSPLQVEKLLQSMEMYDNDFISKTKIHLLNNSSDTSTTTRYEELCQEYDIDHIKKDNLGICGGRQFIAEHAEQMEYDYYLFFEDDMFLYPNKGEVCKNGFNRFVPNLFTKALEITKNEQFDYLKLSFSEFFGDNSTQWAWYNVPQNFREEHWPNNKRLPVRGLDKNAPRTIFNNIKTHKGLPYSDGEIYYCNWPQIVSRQGNNKMFLETTWAHPYEQTWMSYIFQETIKKNINPGILLLSPIEHDRFDHYEKGLRREN